MAAFFQLSLKRKLLAIMLLTSSVALILACVGFIWHERQTSRQSMIRDLTVTADLFGSQSTLALRFGDRKVANEILSKLTNETRIVAACIYTRTGNVFAKYQRPDAKGEFVPPEQQYYGFEFVESSLEVFRPVVEKERTLGAIYLKSDLAELDARLQQYLKIAQVVLLVSFGVAWLVSFRLQRIVSRPILELAGATRAVSAEKNYAIRVRKRSNDELGQLTDGFNEMLAQIQTRDTGLEEARQGLERRVQERTRELELEVAERKQAEEKLRATAARLEQSNRELEQEVAERKQAEEKLRATAARLEQSNRELQDFAYVASHDLQEPLRKVQAFGDRLKVVCSKTVGVEGRDYLERMQAAAKRMQILIDDLLAFSRVTTKAIPFEPVDLGKIVSEVISDLEVRIQQSGGRVETGDLPTIEADPVQMRQLFQNLLGNALKFHQEGRPPVVRVFSQLVCSSPESGTPDACRICVEDDGIGFDEKYLDRIFVLFQRLHGRSAYEGTGIGLAICRKIIDRHRGVITARSTTGRGSTFVVTLPLKQPQAAPS